MTNALDTRASRIGLWSVAFLLCGPILCPPAHADSTKVGYSRARAEEEYWRLRDRFNQDLAGRYPFGPVESVDAHPWDVCDFFSDNAERITAMRAAFDGTNLSGPAAFLRHLDLAGAFLFAGPCSRFRNPLRVHFRALPDTSSGIDHIASWALKDNAGRAEYPRGFRNFDWRFGTPIDLEVTWSDRSPWRPVPPGPLANYRTHGDKTASFGERGPWALMRLIDNNRGGHAPRASEKPDLLPERGGPGVFLAFFLPVISSPGDGQLRSEVAHLSIRLSFESRPPDGPYKSKQPEDRFLYTALAWPEPFPRYAPQLE